MRLFKKENTNVEETNGTIDNNKEKQIKAPASVFKQPTLISGLLAANNNNIKEIAPLNGVKNGHNNTANGKKKSARKSSKEEAKVVLEFYKPVRFLGLLNESHPGVFQGITLSLFRAL